MRRQVLPRALLAILLVLVVNPPLPAAAAGGCGGTGSMTLSSGISYPMSYSSSVGFSFTVNCVTGGSISGSGTFDRASCGDSIGSGTIDGVGGFTITTAGSTVVLSGALHGNLITGAGESFPVPDTSTIPFGNSCSNGTAQNFTWIICIHWGTGGVCV